MLNRLSSFLPKTRIHAGELVQNGRIGRLKSGKVGLPKSSYFPKQSVMEIPKGFDYDFWLGPAPWAPHTEKRCHVHYRWILDYSDGMIADWSAHQLDLAQWGIGMQHSGPVWIEGTGKFPRDGLTDVASEFQFRCGYENGLVLECSTDLDGGVRFEGTEVWVHTGHGGFFRSEPESLINEVTRTRARATAEAGRRPILTDACLLAARQLVFEHGMDAAYAICETIYEDPGEPQPKRLAALTGLIAVRPSGCAAWVSPLFEAQDPGLKVFALRFVRETADGPSAQAFADQLPRLSPEDHVMLIGAMGARANAESKTIFRRAVLAAAGSSKRHCAWKRWCAALEDLT